jgi:adenylate cyclase
VRAGALAAAVLAGAALLIAPAVADKAREAATDFLMPLVPRPEPSPAPVVAVAVGEADLAELGPWPWPRWRMAALVARLAEAGAAAVGLDIAFIEPAPGDAELTAALTASPAVLGFLAGAAPPPPGFGVALLGGAPDFPGLLTLPGATPLAVDGAPAALAALPGDTVRGVPMLARLGESMVPGLAVGVLARALQAETLVLRGDRHGSARLQLGAFGLPLPRDGLLRLHPAQTSIAVLPAAEVLAGKGTAALRGRLVLLGSTAAEAAPLRPSTLGPFTPSLLLQAAATAQLAAGWVPMRVPGGAWTEAGFAILLGTLAAAAVAWRPGPGLAAATLLALLWPAVAAAALGFGPLLLDPALPAAAALLGGATQAAAAARLLARELARERAQLLDRFAHRLPAGILDRLLATPAAERLRPEKLRVAVMITDLAGFSRMVRRSDPAVVVAALNAYFAGIEGLVAETGGTLERLLGDGALVVFGAPVPQPDHAARALAAARAIDRFAEEFRRRPDAAALGWGATRIGVAEGEVMAGEVGGSRLTWTVYGDAANTAARLQELARELGVRALVTGIADPSLPPPLGRYALRGLPGEVVVHPL